MNTPLRRLSTVVLAMFAVLMISTTWIQFVQADKLNTDSRNVRTVYNEFGTFRGPILAGEQSIASSAAVDDPFGYQRSYANGPLYGHVTGFYSIVNGSTEIERKENEFLNGTANDLWLDRLNSLFTGAKPQGSSVALTIDPAVQEAAYRALGNQRGAVVAIEPKTGRILALVSTPSYDPNTLASHNRNAANQAYQDLLKAPGNPLENRAIRGNTYPPGSTFKLVTAAAAIESGDYTADTQVPAPDNFPLPQSSAILRNFGDERCSRTGQMSLSDALRISCNSAFADLGVKLGDDALRDQAEEFGFDSRISIPLTVEPSRFPEDPDAPQTALAAIGQGDVRVTPLQVAMVSAAIANDGEEMTPYLIDTIKAANLDVVKQNKPSRLRQSISPETARQLTSMMVDVVQSGSGVGAQIRGVQVAGKTGTAETTKTAAPHAWFTGFAPADDPQVAVAVIVENGGSMGSEATGGKVAAPIAKAVMEAVLNR